MLIRNYHKIVRHFLSGTAFPILILCIYAGCSSEQRVKEDDEAAVKEKKVYDIWRVDIEHVESGCDRPDCIRSIDAPKFISTDKVDFLDDEDLVIGIKMGATEKCYPHAILNWHEIVNDIVNGKEVAINYCPLTGSGMAWNRRINGKLTDFGVSGMLYNSNIMPYDRVTRSAWSQMKQLCVNGELLDSTATTYQVIETTWGTWKKLYPGSAVVSTETGMQRDYLRYPYDAYRTNDEIYFDVEFENDTLPAKERLFGIIKNGKAQCFRFNNFKPGVRILQETVFDKPVIIVGSEPDQFITAFENPQEKKFKPVAKQIPAIFSDDAGNMYDIFGYCLEGDLKGSRLQPVDGFIAYWFAWYAFYPDVKFQ